MAFFWRAIGMGGSAIPNFNFNLGDVVTTFATRTLTWTLREGTRIEDNTRVTIFVMTMDKDEEGCKELAKNVVKRAKTLLLPGILRCFDATEHNGAVYIATEECVPLQNVLDDDLQCESYYEDKDKYKECVAHGLHHVSQALTMMHQNGLIHGNVGVESVYVLKSGEWRLFGLELVCMQQENHSIFHKYHFWLPEYRRPPEMASCNSGGDAAIISPTIDAWGLGCLVYAAFLKNLSTTLGSATAQDVRAFRTMPRSLQSGFVGLTGANPKLRMPVEKFIADSDFVNSSEYVIALQGLEELALKDAADRDAFYRKLSSVLDLFPIRACKYTILAKLSVAVQYGGGSATALEPILKIGARLTDPAVFGELVAPIVITLFSSPDHLVRCRLLSTAAQYAKFLPKDLVNDKIWTHYVTGFTNKNPDMRELTVRALVHFAPHLSEKILKDDVLRCIGGLQQDREGPIRTNATICLCMIAPFLPEAVRSRTLVHGFGRMLKDPFGPSRVAAVRSILSSAPHIAAQSVAELLLPAVGPLCIDPLYEVRDAALKVLAMLVEKLRAYHEEMPPDPVVAAEPSPSSAAAAVSPSSPVPQQGGNRPAAAAAAPVPAATVAKPAREAPASSPFAATTPTTVPSATRFTDPSSLAAEEAAKSSKAGPAAAASAASDGWGTMDDDFAPVKPRAAPVPIAKPTAAAAASPPPQSVSPDDASRPMAIAGTAGVGGSLKLKKKGFGSVAKAD